jgi:hypothetical protein
MGVCLRVCQRRTVEVNRIYRSPWKDRATRGWKMGQCILCAMDRDRKSHWVPQSKAEALGEIAILPYCCVVRRH